MIDLTEIKAACEKATKGPWSEPHLSSHAAGQCRCGYVFAWEDGEACVATVHKASDDHNNEYPPDEEAAANGKFIALARTALPACVAEIEGLRKALAECAVPIEALRATECDSAGTAMCADMKAGIVKASDAIRAALGGKS